MLNLFISYRRDDTEGFAGWLAESLRSPTDGSEPDEVFLDVDDIAPGQNFVHDMVAAVSEADAVLVIVGPHWFRKTLHNADDAVRLEIEAAMRAEVPIYCVRVDNASAPEIGALPPSLHGFGAVPQVLLEEDTFDDDVLRLRHRLTQEVKPKPRGRATRSATLEVVHGKPGLLRDTSAYSVVLDGKTLGTVMANTPPQHFEIVSGRHRVQIRRGLRRSNTVEFEVAVGDKARLEVRAGLWEIECAISDAS